MNKKAIRIAKDCVGHKTSVRVYKLDEPDSFVAVASGKLKQLGDGRFWIVGKDFTFHFAPESITSAWIERSDTGTYREIYINKSTPIIDKVKEFALS